METPGSPAKSFDPPAHCCLLEHLPCIAWTADAEGNVTFVNRTGREYTGLPAPDLGNWSWLSAVHPDCQGSLREAWRSSILTKKDHRARYKLRDSSGAYRWFEAVGRWINTGDDNYIWAGTLTDVQDIMDEERRRREALLEASRVKDMVRRMVDSLPYPLAFLEGRDGRMLRFNSSFRNTWRLDDQDDDVSHIASLRLSAFHPDGSEFAPDDWPYAKALRGLTVPPLYTSVCRADHTRCVFAMASYPLTDNDGRVVGAVFSCEDITEKMRREERLLAERVMIERSQMRSTFLTNVSHEHKTPLTAVMGSIALLEMTDLSEEQREMLGNIRAGTVASLRRVEDLLDVARLELGEVALYETQFSLRRTIEAVKRVLPEEVRCHVTWSVATDVPDIIIADENKLARLLGALLDNGLKFSRGVPKVNFNCKLGTSSDGPASILFEISDAGIGMSKEDIQLAFTPFVQRNMTKSRLFGGAGLGLSLAKRLTEVMGGTIHLSSVPNRGTTVYVEVPFTSGHSAAAPLELRSGPTVVDMRKSKRLLVAEDNPLSSKVIVKTLKLYGYEVIDVAWDGVQAVEKAEEQQYDLILMDCQMPHRDGYEAAALIRQRDASIPILALSADSSAAEGKWASVGMNRYIGKPFQPDDLIATIDSYITTSGSNH
jgi:PAS domain S-box-containing protein